MPAYFLEVFVVALGLVLLLADAFVDGKDKRWIGWIGASGLLVAFFLTFFAQAGGDSWLAYEFDGPARFFKGIALLATSIVILMGLGYLPVVREFTDAKYGGGEFFVLPIFTCAGLMWAASAADLVSLF
ncbi:MAG: hypothetical protein AAGJ31_14545, partial [Verrucomicrobiota bacterium]